MPISASPSLQPSLSPVDKPSAVPTNKPTMHLSTKPTMKPSISPSVFPTPCVNEESWKPWEGGTDCETMEIINSQLDIELCTSVSTDNYLGKSVNEACCVYKGSSNTASPNLSYNRTDANIESVLSREDGGTSSCVTNHFKFNIDTFAQPSILSLSVP